MQVLSALCRITTVSKNENENRVYKKWTKTKVYHKRKKDLIHRTKFVMAVYSDPA